MSLSHRKQLTAEQYEAMIAMRTDDLEKAEAEIERLAEQYVFEKTHRETCEAETQSLQRRIEELEAERDKLQRFKDWTHAYLDRHGVPHHPPGTHGAEGCRIGDRMDWLMACAGLSPKEQP
jgi:hypothetical protein